MKSRILIVDDDDVMRQLFQFVLEREGYEVAEAESGEEILARVVDFKPNLILLDVMMPRISGLDVCRQLKKDSRTQHVPVIIVSAYTNAVTRAEGQLAGAIDFINKPCSPYQLLDKIRVVTQPPATGPLPAVPNEDAPDSPKA